MRFHLVLVCLVWVGCDAAPPAGAGADLAVPCDSPHASCDDGCVDLTSNPSNCGTCGNRCKYGYVCKQSQCALFCPDGLTACGTPIACVDTSHDLDHCGRCETSCAPGSGCVAGKCQVVCQPGLSVCGDGCVNLQTDPAHCGACGTACPMGYLCSAGTCALSCQSSLTRCDLKSGPLCVNLLADPSHCGDCATVCKIGWACAGGKCLLECQNGLDDCNGLCTNLVTDNANCGKCGNACQQGKACDNGQCQFMCTMPLSTCKGACVDTRFDPLNCGGCGTVCMAANATPACVGGRCIVGGCADGFADCDQMPANGCEINVHADSKNCLACNIACAPAHAAGACTKNGCVITMCDPGFLDCDGMAANGCEIDSTADVANCNGCGKACPNVANAAPGCRMNVCGIAACNAGFADCDQKPGNGCEIDATTDVNNCGGCANVCAPAANAAVDCGAGKCRIAGCNKGFTDCNGQLGDGCECYIGGGFVCLQSVCQPLSCNAIKKSQPQKTDGIYTIYPDGIAAVQVYCDMTTAGGGWTLLMKLTGKDFCQGSANWTSQTPVNEMATLDAGVPAAGAADAKSRAFYLMSDVTALQFVTTHGSVVTTFAAPSTAMNLMTTNNVPFAQYPDFNSWRGAFSQDRCGAPIFMRGGLTVDPGNVCRNNPQVTPNGCGQLCEFCFQASTGCCCGCDSTGDDVSSGVGLSASNCGGGVANCSSAGTWSDPAQRTLIWGR